MVWIVILVVLLLVVVAIDIYTLISDWYHTKRVESGLRTLYRRIRKLEDEKQEDGAYTVTLGPEHVATWPPDGEEGEGEDD